MATINLKSHKTQSVFLAIAAVVIGVSAKLALTGGELLPGIDGAYYWVQVRSVLEDFSLAFDDLPLVFWAQALIALVVGDIPLGVRIADAALPAISAIPIFLLLRNSKKVWVPAAAILVVLLHPVQLYFFTGDFLKNSAAIPLVFFIGWILYNWDNASKKRSVVYLLLCLAILGFAHFGTLLMALMLVFIWLLMQLRNKPLKFWITSVVISLITGAAVLAALALLVPARFTRLIEFISQPDTIFANPALQMMFGGRIDYPMIFSILTGQLGALALGLMAWNNRKSLSSSHLSLLVASIFSAFLLSSPLIGMEWANRLIAMAFVPLFIAGMILLNSTANISSKAVITSVAALTLVATSVFGFMNIKQAMISTDQYQDLVKFSEEFDVPENSIVVAPHGVEFLVAWHEKTFVLQDSSYEDEDLSSYDHVFSLQSTGGKAGAGPTPPAGAKPPMSGDKPPVTYDKPPMTGGKEPLSISGEQVYKNDSYTLLKVR